MDDLAKTFYVTTKNEVSVKEKGHIKMHCREVGVKRKKRVSNITARTFFKKHVAPKVALFNACIRPYLGFMRYCKGVGLFLVTFSFLQKRLIVCPR